MSGPLSHVRVLELARILAGPWAGQVLADLGASVVKVERPQGGDDTRSWGPPFAEGTRESAYFLSTNRGKRSITVDFEAAEGQSLIRALAENCDVLVENFKVGGLKKYGLDWETLRAINPRLIYCSITGFGQDGPYAHRAGYDFAIQAMGGLMSVTGAADGEPMKVGVAVTDVFTGLYAAIAILGALTHRERTGEGQWIDLSLLDTQVAVLANQALNYLVSGRPPGRLGNAHPNIVPYQAFATATGHMVIAVGNDGQFGRLCSVLGCGEWAADARFATNPARVANRAALVEMISKKLLARPAADWLAALEEVGVPAAPINDLGQVFADPQVTARGLRLDLAHPTAGCVPSVASPIRYSATPLSYERAPPLLGADTAAVLKEWLSLDVSDLSRLSAAGVI